MIYAPVVKLACLFFYRTIFITSRRTIMFINAGIVVVICVYIPLLLLLVFLCTPVAKVWELMVNGKCRNTRTLAYSTSVVNASTDIYILVVPVPAVWSLPLRYWSKIKVVAIFSLGLA